MTKLSDAVWAPFDPPTHEEWMTRVSKDLRGADFERRLVSKTRDGIEIQPLYPTDTPPVPAPGEAPWVRGFASEREATWVVASRLTQPDPERAREIIRDELEHGVECVELVFDRAVRCACGKALGNGIAVSSALGLARVLESVSLESARIALDAGRSAVAATGALLAVAERLRVPRSALRGRAGLAPIDTIAEFGGDTESSRERIAEAVAAAAILAEDAPGLRGLSARSGAVHAAGATPALELGWIIASLVEMLREAERQDVLESVSARVSYDVSVGRDVFVEIAAIRALRALHGRIMESLALSVGAPWIVARTSRRTFTRRDPWVNMLRASAETFAAVVGGCDEVVVHSYESPLGHSGKLGRRVARNTQLILREESHLARVTDPAGGSAYVESLTERLAAAGWAWFQQIEAEGGAIAVLESGWLADRIDEQVSEEARRVAKRKLPITGLSEFPNLDETLPDAERIAMDRLREIWSSETTPEPEQARRARAGLRAAGTRQDRVAFILSTAAQSLPWKELSVVGRIGFGGLGHRSEGAPFEALRDLADEFESKHAKPPSVVVATLGPLAEHNARTTWCQNALAAGGIRSWVVDAQSSEELSAALAEHSTSAVLISGANSRYDAELADAVARATGAGASWVCVAGKRASLPDRVATTLYAGIDLHAFLSDLHDSLEANR